MKQPCIRNCKFIKGDKCTLYQQKLIVGDFDDPYDKGRVLMFAKCTDCQEKEISCSIDDKIRDIYSFYHAFREEMDILFSELDRLVDKRNTQTAGNVF